MLVIKVIFLFLHNKKIYAFIKKTYTDAKETAAYDEASDEFYFITKNVRRFDRTVHEWIEIL